MRSTPRTQPLLTTLIATIVALAASLPGVAAGFGDIEDDRYYTDAVAWMVDESLTTGIETGCFGPALNVTRGQVAAFLHRLDSSLGNTPGAGSHPFLDVTARYQQEPIGWMYERGLTTGVTAVTYRPQQSITRGDFAVLVWRYAGAPGAGTESPFGDITRSYQSEAVAWMAAEGITTGTTASTFSPDGVVTRAEAATFLYRFVDPADGAAPLADTQCTRELRVALEVGGLTAAESRCAIPKLTQFDVPYLIDVVQDEAEASIEVIVAAATIGTDCLTIDRIGDLSRVFL